MCAAMNAPHKFGAVASAVQKLDFKSSREQGDVLGMVEGLKGRSEEIEDFGVSDTFRSTAVYEFGEIAGVSDAREIRSDGIESVEEIEVGKVL